MALQEQIRSLAGEDLRTKRGRPFRVVEVSDRVVKYEVNGHPYNGQLASYERVEEHLRRGGQINGPGDIQKLYPPNRTSAYEWAVLRRLNILQ